MKKAFFLALSIIFSSCTKEEVNESISGNNEQYTIHAVGSQYSTSIANDVPLYIKNNTKTVLVNPIKRGYVNDIVISDQDVYAVGNIYEGSTSKLVFWKNGIINQINNTASNGLKIKVSNNDVYILGVENFLKKVWKNGVLVQTLPSNAVIYDMQITNNDFYILGYTDSITLWKNGDIFNFGQNFLPNNTAYTFFINGNDMYMTGTKTMNNIATPILWKNGIEISLSNPNNYKRTITGCFVVGNDIYLVGSVLIGSKYAAAFWKNDEISLLTDGVNRAVGLQIKVVNNDVFVMGNEEINGKDILKIWQNGSLFSFSEELNDTYFSAFDVSLN